MDLANKIYAFNVPLKKEKGKTIFSRDKMLFEISEHIKKARHAVKQFHAGTLKILKLKNLHQVHRGITIQKENGQ